MVDRIVSELALPCLNLGLSIVVFRRVVSLTCTVFNLHQRPAKYLKFIPIYPIY